VTVQWRGEEWLRTTLLPAVEAGLDASALSYSNTIRRSLNGPRGSAPGGPPGMDQGTLSRSLSISTPGPLQRRIAARTPYALTLELGKTIRSRSGKFMTVPLTAEAKKIRRQNISLKSVPNLKLIRARTGRLLLVREAGRGQTKRTEILFVLVKVVVHEARPFMAPGLVRGQAAAQRVFNAAVTQRLAGGAA
jgi:hypothetical protein